MRTLLLACVASLALGMGYALAADLPAKAPPPVAAPAPTWDGFYVGGSVGMRISDSDWNTTGIPAALLLVPGPPFTGSGISAIRRSAAHCTPASISKEGSGFTDSKAMSVRLTIRNAIWVSPAHQWPSTPRSTARGFGSVGMPASALASEC